MRILPLILDCLFPDTKSEERAPLRADPVRHQKSSLTLRGLHALDMLLAAGRYDSTPLFKEHIRRFKYGRDESLAEILGALLADTLQSEKKLSSGTWTLCPVPLHWSRSFDRGFNQSLLLASACAKGTTLPMRELLTRTRPTGRQALRTRSERLVALSGVFDVREKNVPEHVILIDDLSTTGATLEECAKTLKNHGAKSVIGLVVALG